MRKCPVVALLFLLVASTTAAESAEGVQRKDPTVRVGEREVVIPSGRWGMKYFPDGRLGILRDGRTCRVWMTAGVYTDLLEGPDVESLEFVGRVLEPGLPGRFDNGYAGVNGICDAGNRGLAAFYHSEDHEEMPRLANGVQGFNCSVGLALSTDGGRTFRKLGPVLTSQVPKDLSGRADQGVGELCVVPEASGEWLYMYYSSHSRVGGRGVQICLARCPIEDVSDPRAWRKFHEGAFDRPGRGGLDSVVLSARAMTADAFVPHVNYSRELKRYVMIFCVNAYRELQSKPKESGIYVAYSRDGIQWPDTGWQKLITAFTVPRPGAELAWHPTLVLDESYERAREPGKAAGWLYYSYSESWGHRPPRSPHYLVRRRITISKSE